MMVMQLLATGTAMGFIYCLVAIEYSLIWNSCQLLNFAHTQIIMLGAFLFGGTFVLGLGMSYAIGAVATLLVMAVISVILAVIVFIPLKDMPRLYAIIATYELIHNRDKLFLMIVVAVVISIIATRLIRSRWGRCFVAIRDNIEAVPSCGINVTTIKLVAFILATMIGSLAGGLYAHLFNYINPATYNQMLSVNFVSMLVIGGMGSVWGCLLGSAVVVYLPELLRFTGNYYDFAYALIVLAFIVLMPGGLVSLLQKGKVKSADIIKIFVGGIE